MADPKGRYSETAAIIIFFTFNRSLGQYFSLYSECYFTPVRRQHLSRKKKKAAPTTYLCDVDHCLSIANLPANQFLHQG